jgi:membrane dipeptidase
MRYVHGDQAVVYFTSKLEKTMRIPRRTALQAMATLPVWAGPSSSSASELESPSTVSGLTERLNPQVQQAREVALGLLNPSEKELERGLRLHAESVVFDAYGFSPRAAMDGDALAAAIEAGASDIELKDLREEMSMTRYVTDPVEQQEYRDAWRASGVTCVFQNAGEEGQDPLRLIKRLARFTFVTDMMGGFVSRASSVPGYRGSQTGRTTLPVFDR